MRKVDQTQSSMPVHRKPSTLEYQDAAVPPGRPTVAVIIPIFNYARFLADAITSVSAQTREADEIIVVDDCSNDDPATVVAQFRINGLAASPTCSWIVGPSWLPIRRERCASCVLRKSRWSRSCVRQIASPAAVVAERDGIREQTTYLANFLPRRHSLPRSRGHARPPVSSVAYGRIIIFSIN
jgi:cellulose synthase/poly-beta-1,6-N-acetylglucosamine synthase-like glycosyltransferase